jgi:hypothetical protein
MLTKLGRAKAILEKAVDDLNYIKSNPAEFTDKAAQALDQLPAAMASLNKVDDFIASCENAPERPCPNESDIPNVSFEIPDRPDWRTIDVADPSYQPIGVVRAGQVKTLEVKEKWCIGGNSPCEPRNIATAVNHMSYIFQPASGGPVGPLGISDLTNGAIRFGQPGIVRVRVDDSYYQDNFQSPDDPVEVCLW